MSSQKTYAFIDAANLMYGGKKSLGWSVDRKNFLSKALEYINLENDKKRADIRNIRSMFVKSMLSNKKAKVKKGKK